MLVAYRLHDMYAELGPWMASMDIMSRLEGKEEALEICKRHGKFPCRINNFTEHW